MARHRGVTSRHVAERAGVSQSTVSYVLNNTPNQTISEATRERVLKAAAELRYAPNAAARALRTGASRLVLLVLPDAPLGPTIAHLVEQVSDRLEPHGYSVVYRRHRGTKMLERAWREISPAAVVNLSACTRDDEAHVRAAGIPVVSSFGGPDVLSSLLDVPEPRIGHLQVRHLLERGRRTLAYAAPTTERVGPFFERRLAGVRDECRAQGLPAPRVLQVDLDVARAAAAVRTWCLDTDDAVTGVCAYNDEVAFAVLAGARAVGVAVPDDLAVVGVDDVPLAPFAAPPLSTVDVGTVAFAEDLADVVLGVLEARVAADDAVLPLREIALVPRSST